MINYELYPVKEKQATDIEALLAWDIREVGWSQEKFIRMNPESTSFGYEKKHSILATDPSGPNPSTYSMIGSYWHRHPMAVLDSPHLSGRDAEEAQYLATRAVQYFGKVSSGIIDKIVLVEWLRSQQTGSDFDPLAETELAIQAVATALDETTKHYTHDQLLEEALCEWQDSIVGKNVRAIQSEYAQNQLGFDVMRERAIEASVISTLASQSFALELEKLGYDVTLPKPGSEGSGGAIILWDD